MEWQQSVTALLGRVGQMSTPLTEKARRSQGTNFASCGCRRLIIFNPCDMVRLVCCNVAAQRSISLFFSSHGGVDRCMCLFFTEIIIHLLGSGMT